MPHVFVADMSDPYSFQPKHWFCAMCGQVKEAAAHGEKATDEQGESK